MFGIGERIIYGTQGVMDIVDIREETVGGVARVYYVLSSVGSKGDSFTFVPSDSERLVALMRRVPDRDEICRVIAEAKAREAEGDLWIEDGRARSEHFRAVAASGDRVELLLMARQIYQMSRRRTAEGKKVYLADENMMKRAERQLYPEFAAALGIPESEVPKFIASYGK